jgi:hypothetical protein
VMSRLGIRYCGITARRSGTGSLGKLRRGKF